MGAERNVSEKHGLEFMVFGQTLKSLTLAKKIYHRKGHLQRKRMVQISAP